MNDAWSLGLAALAGGALGALAGGMLAWRRLAPRLASAASAFDARLAAHDRSWHDAVQRLPHLVQQTLQVDLDFLARQQAQRDAAAMRREDERDVALRALIAGLTTPVAATGASAARAMPARGPVAVARPRREPAYEETGPTHELSDSEVDALPAELPVANRSRGRIPQAPGKPVLRDL